MQIPSWWYFETGFLEFYQTEVGLIKEITFSLVGSGKNYLDGDEHKLYVYEEFSESIDVLNLQTKEMSTFDALNKISCDNPIAGSLSSGNPAEYHFIDSDLTLPFLNVYGCNLLVTFSSFDMATGQWIGHELQSECTQENEDGSRHVAIEDIEPGLHFIRISRYSPDGNFVDYEIKLDCEGPLSSDPSVFPTIYPTLIPTLFPTAKPTFPSLWIFDEPSMHPTAKPTFHESEIVKYTEMETSKVLMDTVRKPESTTVNQVFAIVIGVLGGLVASCVSVFWCMVCSRYKRMGDAIPALAAVAQISETVRTVTESKETAVVYTDRSPMEIRKESCNEVEEWLKGLELQQYAVNFEENGFDSMVKLRIISKEQDLIRIGIADKYHRNALLLQILEIYNRNDRIMSCDVDCIVIKADSTVCYNCQAEISGQTPY